MPSKIAESRARLVMLAARAGLTVYTYSPGDGVTRYRFTRDEDGRAGDGYFGCRALYTALGLAEALAFAEGAAAIDREIGG